MTHFNPSNFLLTLLALLVPLVPAAVGAQTEWTADRPDGHAPIGVMGDHIHAAGEFMVGYRFMRMQMDGMHAGFDGVSAEEVLRGYRVTPTEMPMDMHMLGAMYAPTDRLTLMAMGTFVSQSMDHLTRMGGSFTTESSGIGDTRLSALFGLKQEGAIRAHLTAGVSLPTGSIDQTDVTPASGGAEAQLPYPMQIGSGTVDLLPGVTILGMGERGSWGVQASGTLRLGENDRGYAFGDRVQATGWLAWRLTERVSASARVLAQRWGDVDGRDPAYMNLRMVPTVRPDLQWGERLDIPLGINYHIPEGVLAGHRLGIEMSLPVYQNVDGPQMQTDWVLTVGWQKSFEPMGGHD